MNLKLPILVYTSLYTIVFGLNLPLKLFSKSFLMPLLSLHTEFELPMYPGTRYEVWVVGCVVCKPILVFYFGPNLAFGLGLRLGPSRTICKCNIKLLELCRELISEGM